MRPTRAEQEAILKSGIFDAGFYARFYADSPADQEGAFRHFLNEGANQDRRPNFYFDPEWYAKTSASHIEGISALDHFMTEGDALGFNPGPYFDTGQYRAKYSIPRDINCLAHYLSNRLSYSFSPVEEFDIDYYCYNNRDVVSAKADAFEHFALYGFAEGREPSADFKVKYYAKKYLGGAKDVNPLLHYLRHKGDGIHFAAPPADEGSVHREVKRFSKPGADFEDVKDIGLDYPKNATVLAFYLPQFHRIDENDEWWGKGFTEWSNIARGIPRFRGHYQPRVPRDLGFYDLADVANLLRQIELAKRAGISGFVYYYYWFSGKRLLEKPLEALLADPKIDFPFCIMWANENWTKRWDGEDKHVLIAQDFDNFDEDALIADFARHFKDARYIRLGGRPVVMIYRADQIPEIRQTLARWRLAFGKDHGEDPIIITAQAFNNDDPREFGADGAIEFPPHKLTGDLPPIHSGLDYLDDDFAGKVYHYDDVVNVSLADMDPPFPLIKTAVPSWDNDARRQGNGLVITGSTPAKYEKWLARLVRHARSRPFFGTPLVCVNAWNEWCEGAYLEPDQHFGGAYINATARAVCGVHASTNAILLVGHDAFASGAQHLLLHIGQTFKRNFGMRVEFLLLGGGVMEPEYRAVGPTHIVAPGELLSEKLVPEFIGRFDACIVNTLACAPAVADLATRGLAVTFLVHEMPSMIRKMNFARAAKEALAKAQTVVFAAAAVRDAVFAELRIAPPDTVKILPQGCYKPVHHDDSARSRLRNELRVAPTASLIIGVGYADLRKGFDLFLQLWRSISRLDGTVHMAWVGDVDPDIRIWLDVEIADALASGRFHLAGYRKDVPDWLNAADLYALTSREDPFPSVVLEALSAGLPVYAFDGTGGMPHFLLSNKFGVVVPHADVQAMANAMRLRIGRAPDAGERNRLAGAGANSLDFVRYAQSLMAIAQPALPKISVAVPNYNYAHYLEQRLASIFRQSHPVAEVIVLDDASTDNSYDVMVHTAQKWDRGLTYIPNAQNSGSVFAQWIRAAEAASGDYIWIAEADDDSDPEFLAEIITTMRTDPSIVMGFCDSRSMDERGEPIWPSYKDYYATVEPDALTRDFVMDGREFVQRFIGEKPDPECQRGGVAQGCAFARVRAVWG